MNQKFEYDEIIHEIPENGGAYVIFPWDIRKIFGRGRVKYMRPLTESRTTAVSSTWG